MSLGLSQDSSEPSERSRWQGGVGLLFTKAQVFVTVFANESRGHLMAAGPAVRKHLIGLGEHNSLLLSSLSQYFQKHSSLER